MAQNILIVIDMQKDFVTGVLGSNEAQEIVPALVHKIRSFQGKVIYTMDTHSVNYMQTQEGKNLPVSHCIRGSEGWELIHELSVLQRENHSPIYEKNTFGSKDLALDLVKENDRDPIESIILTGVCTDICVISNAMVIKAFLPEVPIYLEKNLTAATTQEKQRMALGVMESCQINII